MHIILVLPALSDPRFRKRTKSLLNAGHTVTVFAFNRGQFNANALNLANVQILGSMSNKNYFKRFDVYYKVLRVILTNRKRTDLFYFFTLDFAFIGSLVLGKSRFLYEIGDFSYLHLPSALTKILTYIELKIVRKAYRTLLTSDGFKEYLNKKNGSNLDNLIVMPNKLPSEILAFPRKSAYIANERNLNFGFVGIFRYPRTVFAFVNTIAKKFPNHNLIFYGGGGLTNDFIELAKVYPNLHYRGEFKNPDDLGKIYNDFDIQIACYDIESLNVKLAEPNKLYDSLYFGNPIIATKGTFLGNKVENLNIGYTIQDFDERSIESFIKALDIKSLNDKRSNILKINEAQLIDSDAEFLAEIEKLNLPK